MKYKLLFIFSMITVFAVVSCGESSRSAQTGKNKTVEKTVNTPEFNADSAYG